MGKTSKKRKKGQQRRFKNIILLIAGLIFTFISLIYVLKLPHKQKAIYKKDLNSNHKLTYEEEIKSPFEEKIKLVDMSIFNALLKSNITAKEFAVTNIYEKEEKGYIFPEQHIEIRSEKEKIESFLKIFLQNNKELFSEENIKIKVGLQHVKIYIDNKLTHSIWIYPKSKIHEKTEHGNLILIIDDIGRDFYIAEELIKLFGNKINLAILPYSPYSQRIQSLCMEKNVAMLLHMPMEPKSYPESNPGQGALFTYMSDKQIIKLTKQAINRLNNIVAVNNHMGSKFTENSHKMTPFFKELKKNNLFFVDSLTTSSSVSKKVGNYVGVNVFKRDIFIDNSKNIEDILLQLKKAEAYSFKKDFVIVIGHPYSETLKALKVWKHTKSPYVQLISIRSLKDN